SVMELELDRRVGRIDDVLASGRRDGDRRDRGGDFRSRRSFRGGRRAAGGKGKKRQANAGEKRFHWCKILELTKRPPPRRGDGRLRCEGDMENIVAIATKKVATATKLRTKGG